MVWRQGLTASLLGVIPYSAVRLGMYDGLRWAYRQVMRAPCRGPAGHCALRAHAPRAPLVAPLQCTRARWWFRAGVLMSTVGRWEQ